MHDTIITGGQVFDGSGAEPVQADVAIKNGRIVEVGAAGEVGAAAQTIDARGAIVTPAWVDIHTHTVRWIV
jgi:N-acyl-D-amino-acid deacylase